MIVTEKTFLTPAEAAQLLWNEDTPSTRKRMYRFLQRGLLNDVAERNNLPIIKDGNRYHIPRALIQTMRGDR
ncbi:MAG: hypothetical protein CMI60_22015 [Parvibaculum sp.]|nr:hypothetical protein [Parvibaculum sp.]